MCGILAKVNSPADLKGLSYLELETLAVELREEIIKTISTNGGHLASSLGVVELTLALHRIFNSPKDKIIWDVGHQAYAHKLLTGRKDRFSTIRQLGGLSGFPSRQESPHDAFTTGHAGTSVSAALGMAMARDLKKDKYEVVAVIGDGSLGAAAAAGRCVVSLNKEWNEPLNLFMVVALPSGEKKSPAFRAVTSPIEEREQNLAAACRSEIEMQKSELDILEAQLQESKRKASKKAGALDRKSSEMNDVRATKRRYQMRLN